MFNFPVSLRKPLLNSEFESILKTELNFVVCSISAIDFEDAPLIDSPTSKVSFERTLRYLLFSFHATTIPCLSPVLTVSPTLNWFVSTPISNCAIFSKGIACPDDLAALNVPGCVTDESNL